MHHDSLAQSLYVEIVKIPLIDPHSHVDPYRPAARSMDDILNYHYYTELAHSAGMDRAPLQPGVDPRDRIRVILTHAEKFDNTVQYSWLLEIAQVFLDFPGDRLTAADTNWLCDSADRQMASPDWEERVLRRSNLEKVFLTNDFDDTLQGFDTNRYVPCLRTDELVFHLHKPEVRQRLARSIGIEVVDFAGLRQAITALFEHFTRHGAKACAISLPPDFTPVPLAEHEISDAIRTCTKNNQMNAAAAIGGFWTLAAHCREFNLPFDLMIGVNRRVYPQGVYQGQDLFDQRTSLIQYEKLFNAFPGVSFCVSVLSSGQNQELASYSWIFPNVITSGHWWYSNIPALIEQDARVRLQAVPKTKQIGYYSDMYKLEFGLPKYNMYRRILAKILAEDFVRCRGYSEDKALDLARLVLRENTRMIFKV